MQHCETECFIDFHVRLGSKDMKDMNQPLQFNHESFRGRD